MTRTFSLITQEDSADAERRATIYLAISRKRPIAASGNALLMHPNRKCISKQN